MNISVFLLIVYINRKRLWNYYSLYEPISQEKNFYRPFKAFYDKIYICQKEQIQVVVRISQLG